MHVSSAVVLAFLASFSAAKVSCEGKCGSIADGETCLGSQWGSCCSQQGYCGSTDAFCGSGCQNAFGLCNSAMPNPHPSPSSIPKPNPETYQDGYGGYDMKPSSVPKSFSTVIVPYSAAPYSAALPSEVPSSAVPSIAPSSAAPSSVAPSSVAPSSAALPSEILSSAAPSIAPSSAAPSSVAPSSAAPSSVAPSSAAPSSVAPSSAALPSEIPSSAAPSEVPSSAAQSSVAPSSEVLSPAAPSSAAPSEIPLSAAPSEIPSSTVSLSAVSSSVISYSSIFSSSQASPTPTGPCSPSDDVLQVLNGPLEAQASSFCLAYLGGDEIIQQTSTQTVSGPLRSIIVTEPDQTQQATVDVTTVNHITRTIIEQQPVPTVTQYVTITASPRVIYQKRQGTGSSSLDARPSMPAQLQPFESQRISSACSCIATPVTRTVQATQIQSIDGPVQTQTQPGATVVVTVFQTVQVTTEETINQTLPPTSTAVQTIATTLTPVIIKPKICNVRGLPGPKGFTYDANLNSNQASCIAQCKIDPRCFASGFYQVSSTAGVITGTCRYFDKPVAESASLGVGYYYFNDKAC